METIKISASGSKTEFEVSAENAHAKIRVMCQEATFEITAFLKGEKGDTGPSGFEDVVLLNGGDTYTLSHATHGKKMIIMINNPNPIPTVVLHPGPSTSGPIHVFGPNQPRYTYISILYVLGNWIQLKN